MDKMGTGVGSTTGRAGCGKIAGWSNNYFVDNTTTYVYGGDLEGNVWKFDLSNVEDGHSPGHRADASQQAAAHHDQASWVW